MAPSIWYCYRRLQKTCNKKKLNEILIFQEVFKNIGANA
jgi:hypothetical protein